MKLKQIIIVMSLIICLIGCDKEEPTTNKNIDTTITNYTQDDLISNYPFTYVKTKLGGCNEDYKSAGNDIDGENDTT